MLNTMMAIACLITCYQLDTAETAAAVFNEQPLDAAAIF